ncbi:MAG: cytochrome P450 [Acidimicrobiales bacterium]
MDQLFDPGYMADPLPRYAELRERAPVHLDPRGFWVLARHADCLEVLRSRATSVDATNLDPDHLPDGLGRQPGSHLTDEMAQAIDDNRPFLFRDPPEHTRLRGIVSKAFTPRMVDALRPRIEQLVEELVDEACERGEMDAVRDFAYPLPIQVICEMLAIPAADRGKFSEWSSVLARGLDPDFLQPEGAMEERFDTVAAFGAYFFPLLEERRRHPGDDLLSQLALAEESGEFLSEGQMLSTAILLLVAGHETTVNLISGGLLALVRQPDQLVRWRDDPALGSRAVDELMRFVSPVQITGRVLTEELALPSGPTLPAHEYLVAVLASANRDPDAFNQPDTLDLGRQENRHLGFGFGVHHCLGAPLARLETAVALPRLLERAASIELTTDDLTYRDQVVLRGLAELPVRVRAA